MRYKILGYLFLAGIFLAAVWAVYWWQYGQHDDNYNDDNDQMACIQVIQRARNPQTGEERDFPTPCDVPQGWELVESEETDETANWQTYRNEEFDVEFKYPNDWYLVTDLFANVLWLRLDPPTVSPANHMDTDLPYLLNIKVYRTISELDWKKLGVRDLEDFVTKYSQLSDPYIQNPEKIKIGEEFGYKALAGPNVFGGGIFYYLEKDFISEIRFPPLESEYSDDEVSQIFSTFKFTD